MQIYEFLFCVMLVVFGTALVYPWHPRWPGARWLAHLPLLLPPLYGVYETWMPPEMNIRVDLLLIGLCALVIFPLYVVRLILFDYLSKKRRPVERTS